jgi:hypothetical protein
MISRQGLVDVRARALRALILPLRLRFPSVSRATSSPAEDVSHELVRPSEFDDAWKLTMPTRSMLSSLGRALNELARAGRRFRSGWSGCTVLLEGWPT